jgi:hypothetical protein
MNDLKEEDFWRELFVVKMRREERRIAALPANQELQDDEPAATDNLHRKRIIPGFRGSRRKNGKVLLTGASPVNRDLTG